MEPGESSLMSDMDLLIRLEEAEARVSSADEKINLPPGVVENPPCLNYLD